MGHVALGWVCPFLFNTIIAQQVKERNTQTIDGGEFPVAADSGVTAEGKVEPSSMLRAIAVSRGQNQSLILPARRAQVLPGIITHQNRAVVIYIQNVYSHQCGGRQGGVTWRREKMMKYESFLVRLYL